MNNLKISLHPNVEHLIVLKLLLSQKWEGGGEETTNNKKVRDSNCYPKSWRKILTVTQTDTALDSNIFQKDPNINILEIHLNSQEKVVTSLFLF